MTNQEIDKIIDDAMGLFPHSVPKHILDEIKKIPYLGNPLADLLDNFQDPLDKGDRLLYCIIYDYSY